MPHVRALVPALFLIAAVACTGGTGAGGTQSPAASGDPESVTPSFPAHLGDPDGDTVPEHLDNCPGIPNPDQANLNQGMTTDIEIAELGDVCDDDIDGDSIPNEDDAYPRDTDNDGIDNEVDDDDDGDGVPDESDNCPLVPNAGQGDNDGDGGGDACDADVDDDDYIDGLELAFGSDPLNVDSTPEHARVVGTCADGIDNDLDGATDSSDGSCMDADGDGHPDSTDNCPNIANPDQFDWDDDGTGSACDADDDNDGLPDDADSCPETTPLGAEIDDEGCSSLDR